LRASRRPVLRFVGLFALLMGVFYVASITSWFEDLVWVPYLRLNADVSNGILRLLGQDVTVDDRTISSLRCTILVERGCDAIYPAALYLAAVLAFPVSGRSKLPGVLIGAPALLVINLIRIVSLYFVAAYWRRAFEMMHLEVWQALFIFLAVLFWGIWAWWATHDRSEHADAAA
jgi:exosortase/archaeosortase family protein